MQPIGYFESLHRSFLTSKLNHIIIYATRSKRSKRERAVFPDARRRILSLCSPIRRFTSMFYAIVRACPVLVKFVSTTWTSLRLSSHHVSYGPFHRLGKTSSKSLHAFQSAGSGVFGN